MARFRNWLLTGIPRAGTSLCCRLTARLPNAVALSEPIDSKTFADTNDPAEACRRIRLFVAQARRRILAEGLAESVHVQGRVVDDMVADGAAGSTLRRPRTQRGDIRIEKPVGADFMLLVKHNALFAALLPRLTRHNSGLPGLPGLPGLRRLPRLRCLGIVRNPVAVLASWQTVDLPVQRGRIPAGERFAPDLAAALAAENDVLRRQVVVLDWFFHQYERHLPPSRIVRYEDIVASGGAALYDALDSTQASEALGNRNANPLYSGSAKRLLAALTRNGGAWRRFYDLQECERAACAIDTG